MFAYCGNNPISRKDDGGEFWNVVAGAAIGAVISAGSELLTQYINYKLTGESINWGDVATSALGGAVYGAVMTATGSNTAASIASSATTSVVNGVRNGDSATTIIANTAKETAITAASCMIPVAIHKSLSGKYLKLNKVQRFLKKVTAPTYRGKYARPDGYLAETIQLSVAAAGETILTNSASMVLEWYQIKN